MCLSVLVDFYMQNHSVPAFVDSDDIVPQCESTELRGDDLAIKSTPIPQYLGSSVLDRLDYLGFSVERSVSGPGNAVDHDLANGKPPERVRQRHAFDQASRPQVCDASRQCM